MLNTWNEAEASSAGDAEAGADASEITACEFGKSKRVL